MNTEDLKKKIDLIPRENLLFLPTPLKKLNTLSKDYGVNLYVKRDDMTGPINFGGNKARKLEFIIGEAKKNGVTHLISIGAYQTNAGTQMTSCCRATGLEPILYLADRHEEGKLDEFCGNLLVSKIMECEVHFVGKGEAKNPTEHYERCLNFADIRKKELESKGFKVKILPAGLVAKESMIAYVDGFLELANQWSTLVNTPMDYLVMTSGTGGTLPGLIAGKLLLGLDVKIINIAVGTSNLYTKDDIVDSVVGIFDTLEVEAPARDIIKNEINDVMDYCGDGYGIPSAEAAKRIREVAIKEGLLTDPIYTGKVITGIIDQIEKGLIKKESNVVFLHTGGIGSLFMGEDFNKDIWDSFSDTDYL